MDKTALSFYFVRMAGTSLDVANEFIRLAGESGRSLTPMQLQKLVYIAHGWCLALSDQALTSDAVQAWEFGPVYPELYDNLKKYGRAPVEKQIVTADTILGWIEGKTGFRSSLSSDDRSIIAQVYKVYGEFPAYKLSALTHEANTPWSQTFVRNANKSIDDDVIKAHFKELANEPLAR